MTRADLIAMAFSAVAFSVMVYDRWRIWNGRGKYHTVKRKQQGGD